MDRRSWQGWDYLKLPSAPATWLIEPLLPAGGSLLLYAPAKIGKTYLALQAAMAVQGEPELPDFLGYPIQTHGRVLYVQLDTPRSLWHERYIRFLIGNGVNGAGNIHYADRETLVYPFDARSPEHLATLRQACLDMPEWPVLVIIDTLRESHMLEENNATDMKNTIAALKTAVAPAAVIFVAHDRKSQDGGPEGEVRNSNRGSGYTVGAMDTILRLGRTKMEFIGRAIEDGSMKLTRRDDLLWDVDHKDMEGHLKMVMADPSLTSTAAKAKALATRTGRAEEACRSLLRRGLHAV